MPAVDEDVSPGAYVGHAERLSAAAVALGAGASGGKAEEDGAAAAAAAETARRQAELAGAYARYTTLRGSMAPSTSGTRFRWRSSEGANPRAVRESLQNRYRYVLVDEFQDTNRAQSELVAAAERHCNVTVVGDDDQSIYRFRGAAISNILEFRDRYRAARTVVLRRNYRSLAPILDGAHRLVRFNDPDRLEVKVNLEEAHRGAGGSERCAHPASRVSDDGRGGRLDRRRDPPTGGRRGSAP